MLVLGDESPEEPECGILHCSPYPIVEADGDDSNAGSTAAGGTPFCTAERTAAGGDGGSASFMIGAAGEGDSCCRVGLEN
jgi:hypothetical protein